MRMIQRRGQLRFALEPAARLGVGDLRGEELDRDGPLELGIEGDNHDAHPAFADHVLQSIGSEEQAGLDTAADACPAVGRHRRPRQRVNLASRRAAGGCKSRYSTENAELSRRTHYNFWRQPTSCDHSSFLLPSEPPRSSELGLSPRLRHKIASLSWTGPSRRSSIAIAGPGRTSMSLRVTAGFFTI